LSLNAPSATVNTSELPFKASPGPIILNNERKVNLTHTKKIEKLHVLCQNIRGLTPEKMEDVDCTSFDILMFCETWWKGNDDIIVIEGYEAYSFPVQKLHKNAKRGCGGIVIYVRESISDNCNINENEASENIVWMKIGNALDLVFIYFPPEGSAYAAHDMFYELENKLTGQTSDTPLFVIGDFNAHTGKEADFAYHVDGSNDPHDLEWADSVVFNPLERQSKDTHIVNKYGKKLLDLCKSTGLFILNGRTLGDPEGECTRIENEHRSLIDYVICNRQGLDLVDSFKIGELSPFSDHCSLLLDLKATLTVAQSPEGLVPEPCIKYSLPVENVAMYRQCLSTAMTSKLQDVYMSMAYDEDVNVIIQKLQDIMTEVALQSCRRHIKSRKTKRTVARPWVDDEIQNLRSSIRGAANLEEANMLCNKYKKIKRKKKSAYKKATMQDLQSLNASDKCQFWKRFKEKTSNGISSAKELDPVVTITKLKPMSKTPEEAYFDKKHLEEVKQFLLKYFNGDLEVQATEMCEILNSRILPEEVSYAISKLKKKKSPGLDGLPAEMLIYGKDIMCNHLAHVYNYIIDQEEYPKCWAEGLRVAIPKDNTGDVRPITVTNLMGKLFESIIDKRMEFIEDIFGTNDPFNGGFSKGSSTADNILILEGVIHKQLSQGKRLYVSFIDFKKAFNYVNHGILFHKLIKSGLHGKVITTLKSMYDQTQAKIKINGLLYEWIFDEVGVNQGGPNSPRLFKKFLADLGMFLQDKYGICLSDDVILLHILWADDLVIMSDTAEGLQQQLDGVFNFCKQNHMIVNELKTKVMVYGSKEELPSLKYNGKVLEVVTKYKYLGVIFNDIQRINGDMFRENAQYASEKANKSVFSMMKNMRHIGKAPPSVALHLFDSLIRPILEYSSEVWYSNRSYTNIERIHLKYLKMMLGVSESSSNVAVYGETGRYPLIVRQKIKVIKYWNKLVSKSDSLLVKKVYCMLLDQHNSGFKNWVSKVCDLICSVSPHAWDAQSRVEIREFESHIKEQYIADWRRGMESNLKLQTYRTFKHDFKLECYLVDIQDYKLRKILTRFRLSNHDLAIEKGRYRRIPRDERICEACGKGEIETEEHFLLKCPMYSEIRNDLFAKIGIEFHSASMQNLLTNDSISFFIAKCLNKMFKVRSRLVQ
jgi:exonuclease III